VRQPKDLTREEEFFSLSLSLSLYWSHLSNRTKKGNKKVYLRGFGGHFEDTEHFSLAKLKSFVVSFLQHTFFDHSFLLLYF
jgi:hypothetical protein